MGTSETGDTCPLCSITPSFDGTGFWERYDSSVELASGSWTMLYACKDRHGMLALYGCGDDETEFYYPKFCPECGRKLSFS